MTTILLVRSGRTSYDLENRLQGNLAIPLSEAGVAEMEEVARSLRGRPIAVVYSGVDLSTQQSAQILGEDRDLKVKPRDELAEINLGLWQGMCADEVRRKHPKVYRQWMEKPSSVCPPDGETVEQAYKRIDFFVAKLRKKPLAHPVVIVAPRLLACLIKCRLSGCPLNGVWKTAEELEAVEELHVQ